jgi:hypothetical protein
LCALSRSLRSLLLSGAKKKTFIIANKKFDYDFDKLNGFLRCIVADGVVVVLVVVFV